MTQKRNQFQSIRGGRAAVFGRNQNMTVYTSGAKLGPVAQAVIVALLVALLGLLYLTQLTKTSSFGYQLNSIKDKQTQLAAERDDLTVENARLQALTRVNNSSVAAAMTTPVDTNYAE
ncbi:MAG: hypothetical protein LBM73_00090 [Candidatus Nomurabacteria bacterium]|jgi:hypothetical protein|nr:hypothetical protein [Candidatus Nomurabacteria bacterium]